MLVRDERQIVRLVLAGDAAAQEDIEDRGGVGAERFTRGRVGAVGEETELFDLLREGPIDLPVEAGEQDLVGDEDRDASRPEPRGAPAIG